MRALRAVRSALVFALGVGCSWSAFSDFKNDTPVFAFGNKSFGVVVGISTDPDGTAFLGLGGNTGDGTRYYALTNGRADPSGDPLNSNAVCVSSTDEVTAGRGCLGGNELVGVGALSDGSGVHTGCFAVGYGKISDDPSVLQGPIAYCPDGRLFTLGSVQTGGAGTKDTAPTLTNAFGNHDFNAIRGVSISFATLPTTGANPPLLFGDEADNAAYVYPTIAAAQPPTLLGRPSKANHFGHVVAMGKGAGTTLFAVGAFGDGKVYAYQGDANAPDKIQHIGCAGDGAAPSGDVIAFGDVDGDAIDDLLVAQGSGAARVVQIYAGKDRPAVAASECADAWPASSMVLRCQDVNGAGGCESDAGFASSIAVGDLDGDGRQDVAVGAPKASADGNGGAGVVFLYTPSKSNDVADVRYLGNPESGASFGTAVAIGKVGAQDTLAVSAAGTNKGYVVWCTNLPANPAGARCRK